MGVVKLTCIGGGPAGLYLAILRKKADPSCEIEVLERNAPYQTFGWGVVFSKETLGNLAEADEPSYRAITDAFAYWDAIDIVRHGKTVRSVGHGFAGLGRKRLLNILQARAEELGVKLRFDVEVDDVDALMRASDVVIAADGVNSKTRARYETSFAPSLDVRRCKYVWLGTKRLFDAFTFLFEETPHGIFQVHAYRFDAETSTFIVECTEETWRAAGLDRATTAESLKFLETLFARDLRGHSLMENRASWINFVTVKNASWRHENLVLLGDAAHTAHFSIGSGTKLAIEDSIALDAAFRAHPRVADALAAYEEDRRPIVERTQKAAQDSLGWFENVRRAWSFSDTAFAFSLLTRSKRITYDNMLVRDPALVAEVRAAFAKDAYEAVSEALPAGPPPPPLFTPFRVGSLRLANRVVVSPMCMYSAEDGAPNDFHLAHLGARAMGGAGLVMTEMTDVSADARITRGCAGMYLPSHVAAWKRIVDFVHARSSARLGMQLGHAGRKGATKLPSEGNDVPLDDGWPLLSASAIPYKPGSATPKAMDRADMDRVRADFVRGATMAAEAGFDLLELHMAHGYLLASFLSPLTNTRADAYGGDLAGRLRYPLEVFAAVRAAWPANKPMSVRISATDWVPGGTTGEDAVVIARALADAGADVIDVSTGQTSPEERPIYGRMFQTGYADQVRNEARVKVITVGNISTPDQVNSILTAGRADLCALARPHLADPNWTLHAAIALGWEEPKWPTPYAVLERIRFAVPRG